MLVAAATLWGLWSAWLIFPLLGMPRLLVRAATALLVAEFLALVGWAAALDGCATPEGCGAAGEAARTLASQDVPALAALVAVLALAHAWRRARRRHGRAPGSSRASSTAES